MLIPRDSRCHLFGLSFTELAALVGCAGVLAASALPLYANAQARAHVAQVQEDIRTLAAAVTTYHAQAGRLPVALTVLTFGASNAQAVSVGPFIEVVPSPQPGWTAYNYATGANGSFTISSTDGNVAVRSFGEDAVVGVP